MQFIMILVGKHTVFSFTTRIKLEGILGLAHVSSQESIATSFLLHLTPGAADITSHLLAKAEKTQDLLHKIAMLIN